jgi:DNA-directed RNA polymerase specialized sigma24 family protein
MRRRAGRWIWFDEAMMEARSLPEANDAMERYAAGDDQALAELYDALAPPLFTFLVKSERIEEEHAEELIEQTLLTIHGARGGFLPGAEVGPWAMAIARRLLLDSTRGGAGRRPPAAPPAFTPAAVKGSGAISRSAPRR